MRLKRAVLAAVASLILLGLAPIANAETGDDPIWVPLLAEGGNEKINCTWGPSGCNNYHPYPALDITTPVGTPVLAAGDGEVIKVVESNTANCPTGGCDWNVVHLYHASVDRTSVYAHLKYNSVPVSVGDMVRAGEQIGQSGNVGWSTGPHLHYQEMTGRRTSVPGNGGTSVDPGKMFGRTDGATLTYPDHWGYSTWPQASGTYKAFQHNGQTGNPGADYDGDGVPDAQDDCPKKQGSTSNSGCPLVETAQVVGDFNLDGVDDLATGIPGESVGGVAGAGVVRVIYGRAGFDMIAYTDHNLSQNTPGVSYGPERDDAFGAALSSGDFNGDGVDDLAVGVPGESIANLGEAGAVHIFFGQAGSALSGSRSQSLNQDDEGVSGGPETGDRFGGALAAHDFNGDGISDLAVAVPGESLSSTDDAGMVHVFYGQAGSSLAGSREHNLNQGTVGVSENPGVSDNFGATLAVGDFNRDGVGDLTVAVPGETVDGDKGAGLVHLFYGRTGSDLAGSREHVLSQLLPDVSGGPEVGDGFGAALEAGDFNGDGVDDLSVGVPGEALGDLSDAGNIHLFYGRAGSNLAGSREHSLNQGSQDVGSTPEVGDRFGAALAAGDYNGDGIDDLSVGVPGEAIGSISEAGGIHVFYGQAGANLAGSREQAFNQGSPDVSGGPEAGDRFGAPIASGDFNRDNVDDLVVGVSGEVIGTNADSGTTQVFYGQKASNLAGSREHTINVQNGGPPNLGQDDCTNVGPLAFSGYGEASQLVFYRETDGTLSMSGFGSDNSLNTLWGPRTWAQGWDQFVAVEADASPGAELLLYNAVTGTRYLFDIGDGGALSKIWGPESWAPGWEITPIESDNTVGSELLLYRKTDGSRYLFDVTQTGDLSKVWGPETWATGWDQIVTVEADTTAGSEILVYNSVTGRRYLLDISESGALSTISGPEYWAAGWEITPIESDNTVGSELLLYRKTDGSRYLFDITQTGDLSKVWGPETWATGWDQIVTVETDSSPGSEIIVYNSVTGKRHLLDISETGALSNLWGTGNWEPGWCLIPVEHPLAPVEPPPPPAPVVSVVSKSVDETDRNQVARVSFELSEPAAATTRVRYTTVDDSATSTDDFVRRSGVVTFPRGQTTRTANITIRGDTDHEETESFGLVLSQPVGLELGSNGVVTIEDNDPVESELPVVSVVSRNATESDRNQTVRVTLELSGPATGTTRVRYTTTDGSATSADDYIRRSGLVTFARGQTSKTATVVLRGDTDHEPTESFEIILSQPTGLQLGANGTVTIEDDDPESPSSPVVNAVSRSVVETDRNQTIRVTFVLSEPASKTTRVRYTTVAGTATKNSDYTHRSGLVTFRRGQTSRTANITVRGDTASEPVETFEVQLSQPTGLELGTNAIITIQDND